MTIRERPFCNRLCDCGLPRSGQPVQPVDKGLVEVPCPMLDCVQNSPARPFETPVTVAISILGPLCTAEIVEESRLGCWRLILGMYHRELMKF